VIRRLRRDAARAGVDTLPVVGLFVLALALIAGCAKTGMPGGGPKDTDPPVIVATTPGSGAAGVDRESALTIEFSEEMDRSSVERSLTIDPDVALGRFEWTGTTLRTSPRSLLPDSTTIVVTLGGDARDYHGVAIAEAVSFAFSTGPDVATGTIAGVATFDDRAASGALVWACPEAIVADSAGVVQPCEYDAVAGEDGAFVIRNVRTHPRRYGLVAFVDRDGDGMFDTSRETGWIASLLALIDSPGDSVGGIELVLLPPPGGDGE